MKKVEQFYNKNQFRIYGEGENSLQSYDSLVCTINDLEIILGRDWDYSNTTSKHVYLFLEDYGDINFYGIKNKRQYINRLIAEKKIRYDENMH